MRLDILRRAGTDSIFLRSVAIKPRSARLLKSALFCFYLTADYISYGSCTPGNVFAEIAFYPGQERRADFYFVRFVSDAVNDDVFAFKSMNYSDRAAISEY